jgi:uncharacterized lipoprotein YajG
MKRKIITILLASLLLTNCGTTKTSSETNPKKEKVEIVSGEKDPLMKLLVSGLILLSLNLMITR